MNATNPKWQRMVFYALAAVSVLLFAGLEFVLGGNHHGKNASALVAIVAFVKARYVATDFMELRGTKVMKVFDLWLIAAGTLCIALILR